VDVSVLIPVLDEAAHLRSTVPRVLSQRYAGSIEFLFLDGGSVDQSREILTELTAGDHRVRVLENPGRTTPRALNVGLQAASGEFVTRMDAHTRYPPDYIATGVARLRRGDVVSASGPALAVGDGTWSRRAALALASPLGVGGARYRRPITEEIEVDSGFAGIWQRQTLLAAGGWKDDWIGDEDYELATRLRQAGGRIVCLPAMAAEYIPRGNLTALARQYYGYGRARTRTSVRHPQSLRPSQMLPCALAITLATAATAPAPLAKPARLGTLAYLAALLTESTRAAARGAKPTDAAALPTVFATMHIAFATGCLAGAIKYGPPLPALAHATRQLWARITRST
jgi:succinoglycan biosynthesis protein ExoA